MRFAGIGCIGQPPLTDSHPLPRSLCLYVEPSVSRCEHELRAYQVQYPSLVRSSGSSGASPLSPHASALLPDGSGAEDALPPWMGQAKYMSPLLVAYEARMEEMAAKQQEQMVRRRTRTGTRGQGTCKQEHAQVWAADSCLCITLLCPSR